MSFGAFAGGLAQGIEAGMKLQEQKKERELREQQLAQQAKEREEALKLKQQELQDKQIERQKKDQQEATKNIGEARIAIVNPKLSAEQKLATYNTKIKEANSYMQTNIPTLGILELDGKEWYGAEDSISILSKEVDAYGDKGILRINDNGFVEKKNLEDNTWFNTGERLRPASELAKEIDIGATIETIGSDGEKDIMTKQEYFKLKKEGKEPELYIKPDKETTVNIDMSSGEKTYNAVEILKKSKKDKLSSDEINELWDAERDFIKNKATAEEKETFINIENSVNTINGLKETRDLLKKLMDKGLDGGVAQDLVVGVMKYIGSGGVMSDLSDISIEEFAEITGLDSGLISQQMEIIKDLSGLSYTDKQMEMMQQITGSGKFKTNEAKINAINGYIARVKRDAERLSKTDSRFARKFPHLAWSLGSKTKDNATTNNQQKKIKLIRQGDWLYDAETKKPVRKVR